MPSTHKSRSTRTASGQRPTAAAKTHTASRAAKTRPSGPIAIVPRAPAQMRTEALSREVLARVLRAAMSRGGDFADIFAEHTVSHRFTLKERTVRDIHYSLSAGAGVRVVCGSVVGYAHTADLTEKALIEAAKTAAAVARGETRSKTVALAQARLKPVSPVRLPPATHEDLAKIEILKRTDAAARSRDGRIKEVTVLLADSTQHVRYATSDGVMGDDCRVRVVFRVGAMAVEGDRRHEGIARLGGTQGMEILGGRAPEDAGDRAASQAIRMLHAGEAPSGPMPVVVTNGWGSVLLHEAIGHGIELDFIRKKTSKFTEKLHQRVASDLVTVVDGGAMPGEWGSTTVDDEGTPTRENLLVEQGHLVCYMADRQNALLTGRAATGNGRRQSYRHTPMPRMTNTWLKPGPHAFDDMVRSVKKGLYAKDFSGGQVDITNGAFVFSVSEAYLIEDGKIGAPVKGATLIGDGPDVLGRITMVGNDFEMSYGNCGKDGQTVPVGNGQPHVLIGSITVGGTRA